MKGTRDTGDPRAALGGRPASVEHNLGWRLMSDAVLSAPDAVAVEQGEACFTYREFDRRVRRTQDLLARLGVTRASRVALLFHNDHRYLETLFAAIRLGAVAVPLNTRAGVPALAHVVTDAEPLVVVAQDTLVDRAAEIVAEGGAGGATGRPLLVGSHGTDGWSVRELADPPAPPDLGVGVGDGDGLVAAGYLGADESVTTLTMDELDDGVNPVAVSPDEVCMQPYTSGSTGRPKGCLLTHGGQLWNARANRDFWRLGPDQKGLITAPLYHKNAMICVVKPALLSGATMVVNTDPDPRSIPAEVERHRCTYTTGVPATYEMLLASGSHLGRDLSSLRFVVCGSAPLSEEFSRRITAGLGVPVVEAYGLTEGGPQVLATPRDAIRTGSAGIPVPGAEVRLVGVPGRDGAGTDAGTDFMVRTGEVGEIWVRSPGVALGYHRLPEVTASRITPDGWLRTGDLAWRDVDGYHYVVGRRDEMMQVGGENVYPTEVERLVLALPEVTQVAVVPVPHPVKGQVPVAFVRAEGITEEEIRRHTLERGAPYAHPRRVWFLDALPLGATGKVDRAALVRMAEERYAPPTA
ncbi:class I adenylate-forming enzyme family protein [Actinoalloteichus spitiensis]|uniref:class I adenylate-forming enzyme family protein n=1 Tax=Actinoalloteichus spitiensis TaxID=252394 RepID=UPI00036EC6BB|nr:class I adenylate-forming enzyme family protein [Actinoalloteichus spitiensis]